MKKITLSIVLSFTLLFQTIGPALAQTKITIPTAQQSLTNFQLEHIADFLEENGLTKKCLRKNQPDVGITGIMAVCIILQVFDSNQNLSKQWERAKKLGLISDDKEKNLKIKGFDFLSILFKTAGVTISPLSESKYQDLFKNLGLRLKDEEVTTLATALENGLLPEPDTRKEASELKKKLSQNDLIIRDALAFLYQVATSKEAGTTVINITPYNTTSADSLILEDVFKEIFNLIKTQSYFNANFNEKEAMEAAIKAAVKTLQQDKYIEYYTAQEFASFSDGLNGNLEGIGAYIEEKEGKIIIVSPIEGSPAAKAGLLPNDHILSIDGSSTETMTLQEAVNKIRGVHGTTVNLRIKRNGKELDFSIVRNKITIPTLIISNQNNVGIIKLVQFGSASSIEMKKALEIVVKTSPKAIVIDLRNNPGGFLNEVVTMVDYFLEKGKPIVYLKDRQQSSSMDSTMSPIVTNIPIAILINKGSASASEILAGVLQSYGLAKIYGETSYGKGTVQNIVTLQSPNTQELSAFKFTTAEYLIPVPNGSPKSIDGLGVKPDSNPNGVILLDDRNTPNDEALDAVVNDLINIYGR